MKSRLSNWKEESDLYEVVTGKMTDKEALKKVTEKKVNNKVIINPKLSEAVKEIGGELLEIAEIDKEGDKEDPKQAQIASKQKRAQMIKKQVLMKKLMAVRAGSEDIVAHYEPDGEVVEEVGVSSSAAMAKAKKEAELRAKEEAAVKKAKKVKEDYETKKRGEVLSALDRDKRPLSKKQKEKIAADIVKKKGDTSKSDDRYAYEEFEAVVEYFYAEGINEEGIDLIIEEVGLDDFVDFVDDSVELLTEEEEGRPARKMNVRTKAKLKKDVAAIKADKSDVVARSTPKDVLSRARTERAFKKRKLAKPAAKKETPTPAKKTAAVVKKARKATVAKARKDFDGDGKRETPKQEHRGVRNKKITKAVAKVKTTQPTKRVKASKEVVKKGIRAKVKSLYDAGKKRHRKATQPIRVFGKGFRRGVGDTVKFAKKAKKAVVGEEYVDEAKVDTGDDVEREEGRNKRKFGYKGNYGHTLVRRREHRAKRGVKRGVKEEFSNWRDDLEEAKVDKGKSDAEKTEARNKRNTPPGKDKDTDLKTFITRKPGESLGSARARVRRKKHDKQQKAAKFAKSKERAIGNLKKYDADGDGKVRVIDAGYNPEGEVIDERLGGKGTSRKAGAAKIHPTSGDWPDSDRGAGNKAKRRAGEKVEKKSPTYRAYVLNKEGFSSWRDDLVEKDLTAAERRALPDKDFALPGKGKGPQGKQAGSYPIPDEKHARSALSLVSQHGTPEEKAKVRAKVKKKFPDIQQEAIERQAKDRKKLSQPHSVSGSRRDHSHDVDSALTDYVPRRGKGRMRPASKKEMRVSAMREDKALEIVRANIIKKHGKGAIYDPKTAKKPSEADKARAAADRKKRQDADNKAFADRAKKAGYKNPQDYANVVARYGSEDNMKKGTGLGS